ncbi:MAG: hypothetical protein R2697_08075 [Ilumatobacteraceae bacterium]
MLTIVALSGKKSTRRWWWERAGAALLLPPILFLLLRPERYGLTPNALDPIFYTGYTINFDDIMREVGDRHYFVTRWTAYLPAMYVSELLGPAAGRLVVRWVFASSILMSLWHLGRRWGWNRQAELVAGLVVLTNPMFTRPLLTDYVEWFVVSGGLLLMTQCFEPRRHVARSVFIGVAAASIVISNPFAVVISPAPVAVYLAGLRRFWRSLLWHATLIGVSAMTTVLAGLAWFRWRYGIPNVYTPTITFMRRLSGGGDPLLAPDYGWLLSFGWIYIPAVLLMVGWLHPRMRSRLRSTRGIGSVAFVLGFQYVLHWFDTFARDGGTLEIPYYWSFLYPALAVYVAALVGVVQWRWSHVTVFLSLWTLVLVQARIVDLRVPGGAWFAVGLVTAVVALTVLSVRRPAWSVAAVIGLTVALTVASPVHRPTGVLDLDPRYGELYWMSSRSDGALDEVIWLARKLDQVDDSDIYFMASGLSTQIVAIYAPHVTGHLLSLDANGSNNAFEAGAVRRLAIYGDAEFVRGAEQIVADLEARVLLDERHDQGLEFRLLVVELPIPARDPFEWAPSELPAATGSTEGDARTAEPGVDSPGFAMYGPYVPLEDRRYRVTIEYRSDEPVTSDAGVFDVQATPASGQPPPPPTVSMPLPGTSGTVDSRSIDFQGSADLWEFRAWWDGDRSLSVLGLRIQPLDR